MNFIVKLSFIVQADVDRLRRVVADQELALELATLLGLEVHGHLRHKLER